MMNVFDESVIPADGECPPQTGFGYNRLFLGLPEYDPKIADLEKLGQSMIDPRNKFRTSQIPSGYTYLGQFIDHDITRMQICPPNADPADPLLMINLRTPFFDLGSLYGEGAALDCSIYQSKTLLKFDDTFGEGTGGVTQAFPDDLPRRTGSSMACLVDERNDENLAVAQTHVAFIKFHNAVVKKLGDDGSEATFKRARETVIKHYQWIVLHDYLPKILNRRVLDDVLKNGNKYYFPDKKNPNIPIEFSGAAFRLGHSMVRDFYQWNRIFRDGGTKPRASISDLTDLTGKGGLMSGTFPREDLVSHWIIDWRRFFKFTGANAIAQKEFNFAATIDTRVSNGLSTLPSGNPSAPMVLPIKNLKTGRIIRLPRGQEVANRMKIPELSRLTSEEIAGLLPLNLKNIFADETPLWFYILAESQLRENGETLGEVGSRIVAETIVGLIDASPISILKEPTWKPTLGQVKPDEFFMTDLLKIAGDLNPVGN